MRLVKQPTPKRSNPMKPSMPSMLSFMPHSFCTSSFKIKSQELDSCSLPLFVPGAPRQLRHQRTLKHDGDDAPDTVPSFFISFITLIPNVSPRLSS